MASIGEILSNSTNQSIQDLKEALLKDVDQATIQNTYAKGLADELRKTFGDAVKQNNGNVGIAYRILQDDSGESFIDLKPYFAQSAKAKTTKDGGWYLKIPLRNTAKQLRSAYGSNLWNTISHVEFGTTTGQQANVQRFQKILANTGQGSLAYQWKSSNVTRLPYGNSGRGQYISFRTVSNKSNPSSWVENRSSIEDKINAQSQNQEQEKEIANIIQIAIQKAIEDYNQKGSDNN